MMLMNFGLFIMNDWHVFYKIGILHIFYLLLYLVIAALLHPFLDPSDDSFMAFHMADLLTTFLKYIYTFHSFLFWQLYEFSMYI